MAQSAANAEDSLRQLVEGDPRVFEQLIQMNVNTFERSRLDKKSYVMCRIAALAAMDAPPLSWRATYRVAKEAGINVDVEAVRDVLVAIAPVIGSARVTAAAGNIARAAMLGRMLQEYAEKQEQQAA
jgi:hypothetical protein